jgi:hypothetical protein
MVIGVFVRNHLSALVVVLLLGVGGVAVVQTTRADPPAAGDAVLDHEIAAVQKDVAGAPAGDQRAAAQAKLDVLLREKQERNAARAARPATKEEDAAKFAALESYEKTAAAQSAHYTPLIRATGTGSLFEGMPWNGQDKNFASGIYWRGPKAADGTQLGVWGGTIRNAPSAGGVLAVRFVDDGSVRTSQLITVPGHGPLSIVDERDGIISLRGSDGAALSFDTSSLTVR